MKIIIIGAGKIGTTLIENFIKEGHDVVVVDVNPHAITECVNRYDVNGVIGSGAERAALLEAGVQEAMVLIACTSMDEVNILSCVLAKKLGAKHTIARVRDPQYFNEMNDMKGELGLDLAFNPELQTALEIERIIKFPSAKSIESFASGKALMVEFDILENNPIVGKSIIEISKEYKNKVLFGLIKRGGENIIPKGDVVIKANDILYIIGAEQDITDFSKKLRIFKPKAKSAFIIGGGKIAYYLASSLLKDGVDVKIIEKEQNRCEVLSQELPRATILCGDGTDHRVLEEEGLKNSDAFISLTGVDEENAIISIFAKMKGVDKIVTKIDREIVSSMVAQFGLDTIISPKSIIANHIVKFIRKNKLKEDDGINNLYMLNNQVEVLEFTVKESFSRLETPLKDMKIKKSILIGGIVRENAFILPYGETTLKPKDRVIIVSKEKQIDELKDILD